MVCGLLMLWPSPRQLGAPEHQMESEFYIQARREWDERYGDLVLGKRSSQIASASLMLQSFILGIVWTSSRSKVIPYIVEVGKDALFASRLRALD